MPVMLNYDHILLLQFLGLVLFWEWTIHAWKSIISIYKVQILQTFLHSFSFLKLFDLPMMW